MDILTESIMEELLDAHGATEEEAERIRELIAETENPWDVEPFLFIIRMETK